jgi:hypothetical protein
MYTEHFPPMQTWFDTDLQLTTISHGDTETRRADAGVSWSFSFAGATVFSKGGDLTGSLEGVRDIVWPPGVRLVWFACVSGGFAQVVRLEVLV